MQGELNPIIIWPHQENSQMDTQGVFGRAPDSCRNVSNSDSLKKRFWWWIGITLGNHLAGRFRSS